MTERGETTEYSSEGTRAGDRPDRLYWRSLEELYRSDGLRELEGRESSRHASLLENALDRRQFLKLMGASLALAGLAACGARQPVEEIVPYVRQPEQVVFGQPLFYATAATHCGYAIGLLAESHEGRPTKIEGNPNHPASLGATDVFAQASVLTLYDPDRSQTVTYLGDIRSWGEFLVELRRALSQVRGKDGAGLRILTETITSPTLAAQLEQLLGSYTQAAWHQYEPAARDHVREGARLAFGEYVETLYRFDRANVVLSLGSDFLSTGPASVRYARDFISRRRVRVGEAAGMNRLYVIECTPSCTGSVADHRLPVKASEIESLARIIAAELGIQLGEQTSNPQSAGPNLQSEQWVAALLRDLEQNRGASVVIAGDEQPPVVHALAHAMNQALGNTGRTIIYTEPVEARPINQTDSLRQLVSDMDAGRVEMLVIIGGNPVYNAPADLHFADSLQKVGLRIHHGLYYDETSALCHWHIPETHYLEAWGDARTYDGTATIIQPLIAPLYEGKSAHELLAAFSSEPDRSAYQIVREYWRGFKSQGSIKGVGAKTAQTSDGAANSAQAMSPAGVQPPNSSDEFENWWNKSLHDGIVPDTASRQKEVALKTDWLNQVATPSNSQSTTANPQLEIVFRTDPSIYDGRFANNGWLQELPKPLTKLTWDNAALLSPQTARRLGLTEEIAERGGEHGQMSVSVVELNYQGRKVRAPVWIMPGHADDAVTVYLGYGRERAGRVGSSLGFNAYLLRTSDAPWFGAGLEIRNTNERYSLACTQAHHSMEGRELVRYASFDDYRARPDFAKVEADDPKNAISLYPQWNYEGYAWGMVIDTGTCVGCNACVVACQAENNIPVVGRDEVMHAREMHWLRIDRYYEGTERNPQTFNQPVPCMHCENAPCEVVCPVEATTHSDEGLNEMTYNRCVGTRYCSNNCPYKVRRFNFFQYSDYQTPVVQLQRNPEVTVRSRGVMEKCTYCVQRIQNGKIEAEKEGRAARDGEIMTACQQACPTEAIVFGNLNDPESRVSKLKREPTNYGLLAELNTRPRTTYLATIRNPNPEIKAE